MLLNSHSSIRSRKAGACTESGGVGVRFCTPAVLPTSLYFLPILVPAWERGSEGGVPLQNRRHMNVTSSVGRSLGRLWVIALLITSGGICNGS